jgi:hypothetical protein
MSAHMREVYSLRGDRRRLRAMQVATRTRPDAGLLPCAVRRRYLALVAVNPSRRPLPGRGSPGVPAHPSDAWRRHEPDVGTASRRT